MLKSCSKQWRSASDDAEFSTLRDVRMVIIDDQTISVFQEEFVKRYLSKEASPQTVTNQRRLSLYHEETETSSGINSKKNKQITPSGRGRGNFAPTFPGKDRSTPIGSFHLQGQHGDAVRGRGISSKTVTTTSSPPGLTVTEEGKHLARHLRNRVKRESED